MSKKSLSLASAICLIVFLIISWIPCIFEIEAWDPGYHNGIPVHTLTDRWQANMLDSGAPVILFYLLTAFAVLGIIAMLAEFISNENANKYLKYLSFSPIISCIFFILMSGIYLLVGTSDRYTGGYYSHGIAWGFFVECALIIIAAILGTIVALKNFSSKTKN